MAGAKSLNWGRGQKLACVLQGSFHFGRFAGCVLGLDGDDAGIRSGWRILANFAQTGVVVNFLETIPALGVIIMLL